MELRNTLTVGLYLANPEIREIFGKQTQRMGKMMKVVEDAMVEGICWSKMGKGLQAQWLVYMEKTWDTAVSKLTEFMDQKIKKMISGCDSKDSKDSKDKGKGKATGSRPTTPTDQDCAWVEWIDETWKAQVKDKLGKLPSGSAVAGQKRPAAKEGNSSTDVNDHDDKKQEKKKGGLSS
jgi:hypothetical protein